jgi:hypothetical protein
MAMASERTCWAEGANLVAETVEALTLIAEEAFRRASANPGRAELPLLPPGDVWGCWPAELDAFGYDDLADRVRALENA